MLDKPPKSLQDPAKPALHDISQADSRAAADKAFDRFFAVYEDKYPRAVEVLTLAPRQQSQRSPAMMKSRVPLCPRYGIA